MFTALTIVTAYRALRERTKILYTTLLLTTLGSVWSILAVFNLIEFAAVAWIAAMIISVVMFPELSKEIDQKLLELDINSQLRLGEFFTNQQSGWLKLAYRYGVGCAVLGYIIHIIVIYGSILLAMDYFLGMKIGVTIYTMTFIPITTYRLYKQIKKRLSIENPVIIQKGNN